MYFVSEVSYFGTLIWIMGQLQVEINITELNQGVVSVRDAKLGSY